MFGIVIDGVVSVVDPDVIEQFGMYAPLIISGTEDKLPDPVAVLFNVNVVPVPPVGINVFA